LKAQFLGKDWKFLAEKYILRKHPVFEPEVRLALKGFSGDVAVDVGANMGVHTRLMSKRFRAVIAIEPNPNVLPILVRRVPPNVTIVKAALSDKEGSTTFYIDPHPMSGSSAETILPTFKYNPSPPRKGWPSGTAHTFQGGTGILVTTTTYDAVMQGRSADLVLIDVEGAEFLVLEGMKESISRGQVKAILVELHDVDRRTELEETLSGYQLRWIDPDHVLAQQTKFDNAGDGNVSLKIQ
jgi:FkbM family methyltransferase